MTLRWRENLILRFCVVKTQGLEIHPEHFRQSRGITSQPNGKSD